MRVGLVKFRRDSGGASATLGLPRDDASVRSSIDFRAYPTTRSYTLRYDDVHDARWLDGGMYCGVECVGRRRREQTRPSISKSGQRFALALGRHHRSHIDSAAPLFHDTL